MKIANTIILVCLLAAASLSMPTNRSTEANGYVDAYKVDRREPTPEVHYNDLEERGIIGAVVDVIKAAVGLIKAKIAADKEVRNRSFVFLVLCDGGCYLHSTVANGLRNW